jgi:hypothetical protein
MDGGPSTIVEVVAVALDPPVITRKKFPSGEVALAATLTVTVMGS